MKKVVWAEGVLLGQQHLQQWENYHHIQHEFLAKLISPFWWGIKKITWDEKSLSYGQFILKTCEVIFPNGLYVNYDSRCCTALSYVLTPDHDSSESIYLAIPLSTHIKNITGYPAYVGLSGWLSQYECVLDEYDETREREVLFAHPNLVLLSSKEDKSAFCTIKIAEVRRKNVGEFVSDINFIPACLSLETSEVLVRLMTQQCEWLVSKITLLPPGSQYLSLLNMFLAELRLLNAVPALHPFELYRWLMRLCGAFIFTLPTVVLPHYDAMTLSDVFSRLDQCVKQLVTLAIPAQTISVEWVRETDFLYTAHSIEARLFKQGFYLAITHALPVMEWLTRFSSQVKVGPRSMIESIVASALTGVTLIHVQHPPDNLPIKSGHEYFYIEPKGFFWEQVKIEQSLSLFVSHDFLDARIELIIVNEDD